MGRQGSGRGPLCRCDGHKGGSWREYGTYHGITALGRSGGVDAGMTIAGELATGVA